MSLSKIAAPVISTLDPWANDPLARQREGKILANLISGLGESSFVVSLKGGWGTGKSTFLQRLSLHLEGTHKIPTVQVDAWKTDYLDDPLLAVTSAINDRLERAHGRTKRATERIITGLAGSAGKITLPLLSALAGLAVPGGHKAVELLADLPQLADNFLEWDRNRKSAEEDFRDNLGKARDKLKASLGSSVACPLVIIVDELDRCRPDFAIKFLERIKHFFNVDGLCFVIATDHDNLPQAVKSLYGQGVEGELYLRKFFDFEFNLPKPSLEDHANYLFRAFPGTEEATDPAPLRRELIDGIPINRYASLFDTVPHDVDRAEYAIFFGHISSAFDMQLRDSQQAHTLLMAFVRSYPSGQVRFPFIDCYIACLRFKDPQQYRDLVQRGGPGISIKLRQGDSKLLNVIPVVKAFASISMETIPDTFRHELVRSIHTSSAMKPIENLANVSLLTRSLTSLRPTTNPSFRIQPDMYIQQVLGLTAAFTQMPEDTTSND